MIRSEDGATASARTDSHLAGGAVVSAEAVVY